MIAALSMVVASCSDPESDSTTGSGGITVVAAVHPLAELVRAIGGDRVQVTDLTPSGTEPHDLELSSRDVDHVLDADLVVYLGGGFQRAVAEAATRAEGERLDVLDGVPGGDEDPHIWLDPQLLVPVARAIGEALDGIDGSDTFVVEADRVIAELHELDAELDRGLDDCDRRTIVTAHAAFGRFASRYGLEQQAITGISPESEPDPKRLDELATLVEQGGLTTVFTEALVSPAVAEALAREAGVDTAVLDTLEARAGDATYGARMRANLAVLRKALGCR